MTRLAPHIARIKAGYAGGYKGRRVDPEEGVSSCCGAGVSVEPEFDDCYPDRGRYIGVTRCLACGSMCHAIEPDEEEE